MLGSGFALGEWGSFWLHLNQQMKNCQRSEIIPLYYLTMRNIHFFILYALFPSSKASATVTHNWCITIPQLKMITNRNRRHQVSEAQEAFGLTVYSWWITCSQSGPLCFCFAHFSLTISTLNKLKLDPCKSLRWFEMSCWQLGWDLLSVENH